MSGDPETVNATETEQTAIETPAVEATTSEPVLAEGSSTPEAHVEIPTEAAAAPEEIIPQQEQ